MGVDPFIRRAWYEGADLWSPSRYRRFILQSVKRDPEMAHCAGAEFGYILTSGQGPAARYVPGIEHRCVDRPGSGTGQGTDFAAIRRAAGDRIGLWGGASGFVTVETGSPDDVRAEVRAALHTLRPSGGFIRLPVDNVTTNTARTWADIHALIDE